MCFGFLRFQDSFYQSSSDFNEVPDEIYDASVNVILAAWDRFIRAGKKAHKKRKKDAPMERLEDRSLQQQLQDLAKPMLKLLILFKNWHFKITPTTMAAIWFNMTCGIC